MGIDLGCISRGTTGDEPSGFPHMASQGDAEIVSCQGSLTPSFRTQLYRTPDQVDWVNFGERHFWSQKSTSGQAAWPSVSDHLSELALNILSINGIHTVGGEENCVRVFRVGNFGS